MIALKKNTVKHIKIFIFLLAFGAVIFTGGFFWLSGILNQTQVSNSAESIPYYTPIPENCGILFDICGDKTLFYLDFQQETISVAFADEYNQDDSEFCGFTVDYTVKSDYNLVGYLTDAAGGIEMDIDGEVLRYTGVQITQMLEYSSVSRDIKDKICSQIVLGIAENGFTKEDLLYIVENSDTDLKFNVGYPWVEYIQELCGFARFVN